MMLEDRLSQAIDRLIAGDVTSELELSLEEQELLSLTRSLRNARGAFWPADEATFTTRLLDGFAGRQAQPRRPFLFALGAAAAAVVAAAILGQTGGRTGQVAALMLPPLAPHAAHGTAAAAMAPLAAPQASLNKKVTFEGSTFVVLRIAPLHLQVHSVGLGVVALRMPTQGLLQGGEIRATSLTRRTYEVAAVTMKAPEGNGIALLQTNGLPSGWYRLETGSGEAALFISSSVVPPLKKGWTAPSGASSPGGPFAMRFTATRTEAAFPLREAQSTAGLQLLGPLGPEDPLWSTQEVVEGRQAIVLVFDPTPRGTRQLTFLSGGHAETMVRLP
ncbi:MAG: hypothetical protein M0Z66_11320 [Thermaerobacter sp.]|nr:hypothetical protein [Thermaerobacter sp.]